MADNTTNQTHVEESHIANALNNLAHAVTSDTTNQTKWTFDKWKSGGTTQGGTSPKQGANRLTEKKYALSQQLSKKTRTQINGNALTRQGGVVIA